MTAFNFGLGHFGFTSSRRATAAVDAVVKMLAHRTYGPGYNSGAAPLVGDGTAKTYAPTLQNDSGAAISTCSIVCQGWTLRTTGTTDTGNNFTVTWNVEYPAGTVVGTVTFDVVSGTNTESADIVLSTPIPAGASFKVSGTSTVPNASNYIANLGFAGLRNHALRSTLKKVSIAGFGDSIMTNNNGALYNAALGRCPAYLNSITGTTAATYGANSGANFVRQADLVAKLGVTHVMSNFGTNDFGASTNLATLQGYLTTMRDMVRAVGAKWVHCTMLPRTKGSNTAVTASSVTSSGTTMSVVVPDGTKFMVGGAFTFSGATQTEYNGTKICTGISGNTVSFLFLGSGTTPATGTITVIPWKVTLSAGFMESYNSFYDAGSGSARGQFNAWVRGGAFDAFIEWADSCEPSRDSGRWLVAGEDALLPTTQLVTVATVVNTTRFTSDYNRGSSTMANGLVSPVTGPNAGSLRTGSNNTNGDVTVTAAFTSTQTVGDTYLLMPGVSWMSDDGTHPRVAAGGKGGQPHLDNPTAAWIDSQNA